MSIRAIRNLVLALGLLISLVAGYVPTSMFAQTQTGPGQDKSRTRRVTDPGQPAPSPTPTATPRDEIPQESEEVVRVETNLTSIFFTAADSNKRFIRSEERRVVKDANLRVLSYM